MDVNKRIIIDFIKLVWFVLWFFDFIECLFNDKIYYKEGYDERIVKMMLLVCMIVLIILIIMLIFLGYENEIMDIEIVL